MHNLYKICVIPGESFGMEFNPSESEPFQNLFPNHSEPIQKSF